MTRLLQWPLQTRTNSTALPVLISDDQTGFIKNRCISDNIRTLDSFIKYTGNKKSLDFCFPSYSKRLLLSGLLSIKSFSISVFGPGRHAWSGYFTVTLEFACILNNGWTNNFFYLSPGARHDCPLSPYFFVLSVEILAEAIRNKREIRGIKIQGTEFKLSHYADDTTLISDGSGESFKACLHW